MMFTTWVVGMMFTTWVVGMMFTTWGAPPELEGSATSAYLETAMVKSGTVGGRIMIGLCVPPVRALTRSLT
jgi:hypothetical protein